MPLPAVCQGCIQEIVHRVVSLKCEGSRFIVEQSPVFQDEILDLGIVIVDKIGCGEMSVKIVQALDIGSRIPCL